MTDQVPRDGSSSLITQPVAKDFEYTVRLGVTIPRAWAQVLKTVGAHHYDYKCREMSECGVVNGLFNSASFNEDPEFKADNPSWPSTHPVTWRDCDGMMKIMEQAHYTFDLVVIGEIRAWLRRTMDQIQRRHHEITSEPEVVPALREALRRTQFVQKELTRPDAVDREGVWAPAVKQRVAQAEAQLLSALEEIGGKDG